MNNIVHVVFSKFGSHLVVQIINLYRDPAGENIFNETSPNNKRTYCTQSEEYHNIAVGLTGLTDTEKVSLLTSRVTNLEQKVKDKDRRIAELESIVNS